MEDVSKTVQVPAAHIQNLFGQFDRHIRKMEQQLQVSIVDREGEIRISGEQTKVERAGRIMKELVELSERGNIIQEQNGLCNYYEHGRK